MILLSFVLSSLISNKDEGEIWNVTPGRFWDLALKFHLTFLTIILMVFLKMVPAMETDFAADGLKLFLEIYM